MEPKELMFTGERMVPRDAPDDIFWEHIYRYRFATNLVKDKRVLDIASGEGYGVAALLQAGAKNVIGIDLSHEAVAYACRKYGNHFVQGDASHIPLADRTVDVIISFETIEHLDHPETFIKECSRLLAPGGMVIFSTPDLSASQGTNPFHTREFSKKGITDLIMPYFTKLSYFDQVTLTAPWWSPRAFSAIKSQWMHMRGMWRMRSLLRRMACPHIILPDLIEKYRETPIDAIIKPLPNSPILNPYVIRKCSKSKNTLSVYFLVTAELR